MRRTILLLVTVALVLLLVGGVAASQQQQEQSTSSKSSATSDKSGGDVSIQSLTVKASFASGSGANFLGVKVSNHGNLVSFESPAGQEALNLEGYAVCSNVDISGDTWTSNGYDMGVGEAGFGTPRFSQPNPRKFPLTVTRNTTDGKFQLKQVWAKPDATEKDVTVTMTLKNISSSTINDAGLIRTGDFDVGPSFNDRGAITADSAWQWDDEVSGPDSPGLGLMLTALTFSTKHFTGIFPFSTWPAPNGASTQCENGSLITPTAPGDYAMRVFYILGDLSAGQSKTVKFSYGRM